MTQQTRIKVVFDNTDEDSDDRVALSADMITLTAGDHSFVPVMIVGGNIAYYAVEDHPEGGTDLFWDALEEADWCYTEARQLHDDETIPA